MRILVVDDELVSRMKAQKILSQYGECTCVVSGTEALEAFRFAHEEGEPYNLITMDIIMPDMSGIEVLKKIREWEESRNIQIGKGVKVVMLTATKSRDTVFPSFREGCEAYIVKPFTKGKLVEPLKEFGFVEIGNSSGWVKI